MKTGHDTCPPIQQVGEFLDTLLQGRTLPSRCSFEEDIISLPSHHHSVTSYITQPLYSCSTYCQMDLQCLILQIFSGIPEAYQMLRCQETTTEEELNLFLKRIEKHYNHYIMLDVNKLSFKLQEVSYSTMNKHLLQCYILILYYFAYIHYYTHKLSQAIRVFTLYAYVGKNKISMQSHVRWHTITDRFNQLAITSQSVSKVMLASLGEC